MPLPVSYRGEIEIDRNLDTDGESERRALVDHLNKVKATAVSIEGDRVAFKGGVFRLVSSWNILNAVSHGYIEVTPSGRYFLIRYFLDFKQLLAGVSGMILLVFAPLLMTSDSLPIGSRVSILISMWLWVFGMNVLITLLRFPGFIREGLGTVYIPKRL